MECIINKITSTLSRFPTRKGGKISLGCPPNVPRILEIQGYTIIGDLPFELGAREDKAIRFQLALVLVRRLVMTLRRGLCLNTWMGLRGLFMVERRPLLSAFADRYKLTAA